ncbi:FeoA domain-containing protein [Desulfurella sp.]|uniref:FeoA domain-containing protein n=1 Tax=Desulfurella sp. TaxID=1962857 RepID=UPI003D11CE21
MSEVKALSEFLQNGHTKFEVVKIEGGKELRDYLEQEGIKEGKILVLEPTIVHEHHGPLAVEFDSKEVILSQGIAEKIIVEAHGTKKNLLELEANDTGIIKSFECGKKIKEGLDKIGLKVNINIKVKGHLTDETYNIQCNGQLAELCTGEASMLLIKTGEKILQLPQLKTGDEGKLEYIISGIALEERLKDAGIQVGKTIKLISKTSVSGPAKHIGCNFHFLVEGKMASIGHGITQKIKVKPVE